MSLWASQDLALRRLEVYLDEERDVKKQRGYERRQGDLVEGHLEKLGHDEGGDPMTGGVIWPPVEAQASIAAARCGRTRALHQGNRHVPTVMTFETMLPEIDPNKDEPTIAILAGPRDICPSAPSRFQ